MKIYLIRHGETDWNKAKRIQGREDISLNNNGIHQANECGKALQMLSIDCIVASPLKRAKETAEIIASYFGIKNVIVDHRLIERDFGRLSGLTFQQMKEANNDDEMEDWNTVSERMMDCLLEYKNNNKYKNVIMISHGAAINSVLSVLSNHRIGTGITKLNNACINILQDNDKSFDIIRYNLIARDFERIQNEMKFKTLIEKEDIMEDLPECIMQYVKDERYITDTTGRSNSKILMFQHMVLKIEPSNEALDNGNIMLKWLQGKVPVPNIIKHCSYNGVNYLLMSKVEGEMACSDYYMNRLEEMIPLLAEGLKLLWKVDIKDCPVNFKIDRLLQIAKTNILKNIADMTEWKSEAKDEYGFKTPMELYDYLCENRPKEELCLVHGDYCLPNVILADGKVQGFVDLKYCGISDRWLDIALCVRSIKHNLFLAGKEELFLTYKNMFFDSLQLKPEEEKMKYYILLLELFE